MDNPFRAPLHLSVHLHQPGRHDGAPLRLKSAGPEDDIGNTRFIFQRDENRLAIAGPLPDENQPRHRHALARRDRCQIRARQDLLGLKHRA